nr:hypothetical protein CFP56_72320 [Quercus suber]
MADSEDDGVGGEKGKSRGEGLRVVSRSAGGLPPWKKGPLKTHKKSSTTKVNDPIIKDRNVAVMDEGKPIMEDVVNPVFVPTSEVTLSPFGSTFKCITRVELDLEGKDGDTTVLREEALTFPNNRKQLL